MATTTKPPKPKPATSLDIAASFHVNREQLTRIIAFASRRGALGYDPPLWAKSAATTERGVAELLHKYGADFFRPAGNWNESLADDHLGRAMACGRLIVARFFNHLR